MHEILLCVIKMNFAALSDALFWASHVSWLYLFPSPCIVCFLSCRILHTWWTCDNVREIETIVNSSPEAIWPDTHIHMQSAIAQVGHRKNETRFSFPVWCAQFLKCVARFAEKKKKTQKGTVKRTRANSRIK